MSAPTPQEWPVECSWCGCQTGTAAVEGSSSICPSCLAAHFPEVEAARVDDQRAQLGVWRGVWFAARIEAAFVALALVSYWVMR